MQGGLAEGVTHRHTKKDGELRCANPPYEISIHNKQLRPRLRRRPVRGVAEIRDLIAHSRRELERAPVAQFGVELTFQYVEHMAAVTPVIGEIARRILHHPHPQIADIERAPQRFAGFAGMFRRGRRAPVGDGEGQCRNFHAGESLVRRVGKAKRAHHLSTYFVAEWWARCALSTLRFFRPSLRAKRSNPSRRTKKEWIASRRSQ